MTLRNNNTNFPDTEYEFTTLSDKISEYSTETYNWISHYIAYRKHADKLSEQEIEKELTSLKQPIGKIPDGFRGALLGLAVGDALGTTNEFKPKGSFEPISGMTGGGMFSLEAGEWTDDTSMAYALGQSLILRDGFDPQDQMDKYATWYTQGAFSSNGFCFDIGNTVRSALKRFEMSLDPYSGSTHPQSAGNGSLMRLAPVVLFFFKEVKDAIFYAGESSKTTHGAEEAIRSCQYFAGLLHGAIRGVKKEELLSRGYEPYKGVWRDFLLPESIQNIMKGSYLNLTYDELSPTAYVINSMTAALWCFSKTESFKEGALLAANLGGDADTIAAIYGQIAGAYYGESNIPGDWIDTLNRQYIFYIQADKMLRWDKCV